MTIISTSENPANRRAEFESFYREMLPTLVGFVDSLGIRPAHEVLNDADQYLPFLDIALRDFVVNDNEDGIWLATRVGYFIGEWFVQRFSGCWYVDDADGSNNYGRYVVGNFTHNRQPLRPIDPFKESMKFVLIPPPRSLAQLISDIGATYTAE